MSTPPPAGHVEARVQGDVSGQVAIGSYIYQIGEVHGGVINILPPEQRPELRARPRPVRLRPRPFRGLLGREQEVLLARAAVDESSPLEVHGELGSGRTSLLRYLAYELEAAADEDGIVHLSARGEGLDGILQALIDAFFESIGTPRRLTPTELRHRLSDIRALVLVDDVELDRESLVDLTDGAPGCAFVVTTTERRAWGDFRSLELGGLPAAATVELWEREAGPIRDAAERQAVEAVCASVGGLPLRILQAAAAAKEKREDAAAVAARLEAARTPDRPAEPAREAVGALDARGRRLLAALIAAASPLSASQIALLADLPDAEQAAAALDDLLRRRLVTRDGSRFAAAVESPELAAEAEADEAGRRRSIAVVAAWAAARGDRPAEMTGDVGLLERSLERALALQAWPHAVSLARSLDGVLSLTGRWDAWHRALERVAAAATLHGDGATEAWALHQQGTRAAALGDTAAAAAPLARALAIRTRLGDAEGAALTRHNMQVAGLPVPSQPTDAPDSEGKPEPSEEPAANGSSGGRPWGATLAKIAAGGVAIVALGLGAMNVLGASPETSPARLDFGTVAMADTSSALTVTVTNRGFRSMRVEDVALARPALGFVLGEDDCTGATLRRGGQCEVSLRFAPLTDGEHTGRLDVAYGGGTVGVALAGTGKPAAVGLGADTGRVDIGGSTTIGHAVADADHVDFGALQMGGAADRTVTIRNDGSARVRLARIEPPASGAFGVDDAKCRDTWLEPGAACEVVVRFRPEQVGDAAARLAVVPEGGEPIRIDVRGKGVPVPVGRLAIEPAVADFGAVTAGDVATADLRVQNAGTAPVTVAGLHLQGSPFFVVRDVSSCQGVTLQPGGQCTLRIAFSPTAAGDAFARLTLAAAAPVQPATVPLRGSARERPVGRLEAKPSPVQFSQRPVEQQGAPVTVELGNAGNGPLRTGAIELRGAQGPEFRVVGEDCQNRVLEPRATCRIAVAFVPGGVGVRRADLLLRTDLAEGLFRIGLEGFGTAPLRSLLAVDPTQLTFGQAPMASGSLRQRGGAPVGESRTVRLVSTGNAPVQIGRIQVVGDAGDFDVQTRQCLGLGSLAPGQRCEIQVTFQPRAAGPRNARLVIEHSGAGGGAVVALAGTGIAAQAPPPPPAAPPDLVVGIGIRGPVRAAPSGAGFLVPIRIQVTNRGGTPAGAFKVAIEAAGMAVPFDASGAAVTFYAQSGGLGAGQSFSRDGMALVRAGGGQTMGLTAFVDSCSGEEFAPPYCRVRESDENNNRSGTAQARMPAALGPEEHIVQILPVNPGALVAPPDLVVRLALLGAARPGQGGFLVPIQITVSNHGGRAAGPFKVAIEAAGGVVPFDASGGSTTWYAQVNGLAAGRSFTRNGMALVRVGEGQIVRLTAFVDSCSGEELQPAYCKVQESNENNNRSAPVQVQMPAR